jgi:hypothetical protein
VKREKDGSISPLVETSWEGSESGRLISHRWRSIRGVGIHGEH